MLSASVLMKFAFFFFSPFLLLQANSHFSFAEPWKLVKDPTKKDRLDVVLWHTMEAVRLSALMLQPIMPSKTSEILDQLDIRKDERTWEFAKLGRGWETEREKRRVVIGGPPMFPPLNVKK